jgi:hypothetical protein
MKSIITIILVAIFLSSCSPKIETKVDRVVEYVSDVKETIVPVPTKILESGIPDKHLIKTAFIPQAPEKNWDQPWQDACEEASLLTLKYFYKGSVPSTAQLLSDYQQIFSYESDNGLTHDININSMSQVATNILHLNPQIIENPKLDDIKKFLAKDIPIIITANGKTLYQENKNFKSGGPWYHSLVILGYDDNIGKFIVHDVGTQHGAYFKYTYELLLKSIHDFPISNHKQDIDQGDRKALVLLKYENE